MTKILVAGSLNMDLAVRVPHIPAAGETILGGDLLQSPGGKGANQAYAAAKLAQHQTVTMLGCVGQDDFGHEMLRNLSSVGCDTSRVNTIPGPSGVALIVVSKEGENAIVVASGANNLFTPDLAHKAETLLDGASSLLLQLEIPLETVKYLAAAAQSRGVRVILDPAPAPVNGLPADLLRLADIITPNETEAMALTGSSYAKITPEAAIKMSESLAVSGCRAVILKLGARGCLAYQNGQHTFIPAPKVEAVDTTAAGDVFNAALAVALGEGTTLTDACIFANQAAALSVTKKGAQLSAPSRLEVNQFAHPTA
jgi:ribokinase